MSDTLHDPHGPDAQTLARFLSGECARDEADAVARWIAADPSRQRQVETLRAVWSAAATRHVTLDLDEAWRGVVSRIERAPAGALGRPVPTRQALFPAAPRRRHWVVGGIAVAAMLIATVAIRYLPDVAPRSAVPAVMRQVATARGQRASIQLGDGTRVVLGVESKLRFPDNFGAERRDVYLDGEGYFEVTHDARKPFIVHTNGATAEDLGTAFDVRDYATDSAVQVVVVSGSVALHPERAGAPGTVLAHGQLGRVTRRSQRTSMQTVDPSAYLAWRDGRLVFEDAPLSEVLAQLHRWYDVDFQLADSTVASRQLAASFDGQSITEVLDFVAPALDLRYERRGRTITFFPYDGPR